MHYRVLQGCFAFSQPSKPCPVNRGWLKVCLCLPQAAAGKNVATHLLQLHPAGRAQLPWLVCVAAKREQLLAVLLSQPISQANCRQHHQQDSHKAQQEFLSQVLRALATELRGRQRGLQCQQQWCGFRCDSHCVGDVRHGSMSSGSAVCPR